MFSSLNFDHSPDEFDSDVGEDELDEELVLPEVLATISYEEKKELYRFKHTHNEVYLLLLHIILVAPSNVH